MAAPESHSVIAERRLPKLPASRVQRVVQYVDDNLQSRIRLAELSALVHMSPYHFARLFAGSTGTPPYRFVIRRRIEEARVLLGANGAPVSAIARSVGFCTVSHFTSTFRRLVGLTPTAYRAAAVTGAFHAPHDQGISMADTHASTGTMR